MKKNIIIVLLSIFSVVCAVFIVSTFCNSDCSCPFSKKCTDENVTNTKANVADILKNRSWVYKTPSKDIFIHFLHIQDNGINSYTINHDGGSAKQELIGLRKYFFADKKDINELKDKVKKGTSEVDLLFHYENNLDATNGEYIVFLQKSDYNSIDVNAISAFKIIDVTAFSLVLEHVNGFSKPIFAPEIDNDKYFIFRSTFI